MSCYRCDSGSVTACYLGWTFPPIPAAHRVSVGRGTSLEDPWIGVHTHTPQHSSTETLLLIRRQSNSCKPHTKKHSSSPVALVMYLHFNSGGVALCVPSVTCNTLFCGLHPFFLHRCCCCFIPVSQSAWQDVRDAFCRFLPFPSLPFLHFLFWSGCSCRGSPSITPLRDGWWPDISPRL